jgi:anthranilate 1,2-dioxygenase small subunit
MTVDMKEAAVAALDESAGNYADERAITALIHRAARLADEQKFLDWMELFTDDGVYSAITRENVSAGLYLFRDKGKGMLHTRVGWLMGLWQVPRGTTTHLVSNLEIEILDANNATCRSVFLITRTGELDMTKLHASGRYADRLQKVDGVWRFKVRDVVVDTSVLPSEFTDLL